MLVLNKEHSCKFVDIISFNQPRDAIASGVG